MAHTQSPPSQEGAFISNPVSPSPASAPKSAQDASSAASVEQSTSAVLTSTTSTNRVFRRIGFQGVSILHRVIDRDGADHGDVDDLDDDNFDGGDSADSDSDSDDDDRRRDSKQADDRRNSGPDMRHNELRDANQPRSRFIPEQAPSKADRNTADAKPVASQSKGATRPSASTEAKNGAAEESRVQQADMTKSSDLTKVAAKASPKQDPLAPSAKAPYGYKFVKVRKPDGAIAQVKRPLKAEEAAAKKDASEAKATLVETLDSGHSTDVGSDRSQPAAAIGASNNKAEEANEETSFRDAHTFHLSDTKQAADKSGIRILEKEIVDEKSNDLKASAPRGDFVQNTVKFMQLLSWLVMVTFPIIFIALAVWAAVSNNKKVPDSFAFSGNDRLSEARDVAASLWPIVFAAVVAQTLKAYAAYKVERGIPLITLEQLISSHSVGGAVKQPFMLRQFNWTSIVLALVWALSPLAGQAILRMFAAVDTYPTYHQTAGLTWFAPQNMNYTSTDLGYNDLNFSYSFVRINSMYESLLISNKASQEGATDAWGNIKIPIYNESNILPGQETDGWIDPGPEPPMSSLLGIPFSLNNDSLQFYNYSFSVNTTYFVLDCSDFTPMDITSPEFKTLNFTVSPSDTLYLAAENNTELSYFDSDGILVPMMAPGASGVLHFGSALIDAGEDDNYTTINYSRCPYHQLNITSEVYCEASVDSKPAGYDCQVWRQRPNPANSEVTPLGFLFAPTMAQTGVAAYEGPLAPYSDTEQYIFDPQFGSVGHNSNDKDKNDIPNASTGLSSISAADLSQKLGRLVNTMWLMGTMHVAFLGSNLTYLAEEETGGILKTDIDATYFSVTLYEVHWAWLAVLVLCATILLLAGVACAALEKHTIGPDFLGFANTAIKRNVKLPKDMGQLSARDRLVALERCEILLQDVKPQNEVGKIALGVKDGTSKPLVKGRQYR